MASKVKVEAKHEIQRKQCSRCGIMNIYPLTMKDSRVYLYSILWQEYGGMVICTKCFVGIRAA